MIIIVKQSHTEEQLDEILKKIDQEKVKGHMVRGATQITISLLGPVEGLDIDDFKAMDGIEEVVRISKPFKLASLEGRKSRTQFNVGGVHVGGRELVVMAGPCSVESEDQTMRIARSVKASGAQFLRGGAFKPRSSPYAFQGLGEEGLKILAKAREETGLLVISEGLDVQSLEMVAKYVDIIQIGARNMQNYALLKALGQIDKPVMLKRGMSATIDEWLMSAEYILSNGNEKVILCERGIRSFDSKYSRNTLDLNVVPIVKQLTHLPIIVDPSHGTGYRYMVSDMSLAGVASGADGIIVEVHDRPEEALSDGPQALLPEDFDKLVKRMKRVSQAITEDV